MLRSSPRSSRSIVSVDEESVSLTSADDLDTYEKAEKNNPAAAASTLFVISPRGILLYAILTAALLQGFSTLYMFRGSNSPSNSCGGRSTENSSDDETSTSSLSSAGGYPVSKTKSWKRVTYFGPISSTDPSHKQKEPSCCEIEGCQECNRAFLAVHKMGHDMTTKIKNKFFPDVTFSYPAPFTPEFKSPPGEDYRHVFITRNLYDAILSGYLFHKRGSECFDDEGNPIPGEEGWLYHRGNQWEAEIREVTRRHDIEWPASRGRNMCSYLAEESERDGLRVFVEWVWLNMLRDLVALTKDRRNKEVASGVQKTMHVCFEDLSGDKYSSLVKEMGDFLYPHQEAFHLEEKPSQIAGAGKHGTTKDTTVRDRLRAIIAELDYELFDNLIAFQSNDFGCGKRERE